MNGVSLSIQIVLADSGTQACQERVTMTMRV